MEIVLPCILIGKNSFVEIVNEASYLKSISSPTIKNNKLTGARIYDSADNCYSIADVITKGRSNRWWQKFELFNPLMDVELKLEKVPADLNQIKAEITADIKGEWYEFWDGFEEFPHLEQTIAAAGSVKEIILYLKSLRNI